MGGRTLATFIEAAMPLVIAAVLGKSEAGLLGKILLIYTTIELVLTSGLPVSLSYMLPGRPLDERAAITRKLTKLLYGIGAMAGAGFIGASVIAANIEPASSVAYLGFLALLPLGDVPSRVLPQLLIVEGAPVAATVSVTLRSFGRVVSLLVPVLLGVGLPGTLLTMSAFGLVMAAVCAVYVWQVHAAAQRVVSPVSTRELVRFSLPVGATDLVANLNGALDKVLIATLFTAAIYADYQFGAFQIPIVPSIVYAVGIAYAPRFTELLRAGQGKAAVDLWRAQSAKTALLIVPISMVFIVAAEPAMVALFGAKYLNGASVLRLYSIMTLGRITSYGTLIVSAGRASLLFRAAFIAFAANVVISVPLVFLMGFNGPALGTVLAFIPTVLIYVRYISISTGVPFAQVFPMGAFSKAVGLGLLSALPAVACGLTLFDPARGRLASLLLFAVQATLVLVAFAFLGTITKQISRDDWRFLVGWLVRRKSAPPL